MIPQSNLFNKYIEVITIKPPKKTIKVGISLKITIVCKIPKIGNNA
jgi:hypothetical protein